MNRSKSHSYPSIHPEVHNRTRVVIVYDLNRLSLRELSVKLRDVDPITKWLPERKK